MQLEAVSSHPVTSHLGEETDTHLTPTSFQAVVESDKVSPQPPLLWTLLEKAWIQPWLSLYPHWAFRILLFSL